MSTVVESTPVDQDISTMARGLQNNMGAVSISFTWFGVTKMLSDAQKDRAAGVFDADKELLSAQKKLIDTKNPLYRACTKIKSQATRYWQDHTMPYPQSGIRLIKREDVTAFDAQMEEYGRQLDTAVANLATHYSSLKDAAREKLGDLFDAADYPATLEGQFALKWTYPSVEPPNYLMSFNPTLYRQEQERIQKQFEQAIEMAEEAFCAELNGLVEHLVEILHDNPDGTKKTFKSSTVENFQKFYDEFRRFNVRENSQLERLVMQARDVVSGVDVEELRKDTNLRTSVSQQMQAVRQQLSSLVSDAPRRRVRKMD
jgi:hypothetical protein